MTKFGARSSATTTVSSIFAPFKYKSIVVVPTVFILEPLAEIMLSWGHGIVEYLASVAGQMGS